MRSLLVLALATAAIAAFCTRGVYQFDITNYADSGCRNVSATIVNVNTVRVIRDGFPKVIDVGNLMIGDLVESYFSQYTKVVGLYSLNIQPKILSPYSGSCGVFDCNIYSVFGNSMPRVESPIELSFHNESDGDIEIFEYNSRNMVFINNAEIINSELVESSSCIGNQTFNQITCSCDTPLHYSSDFVDYILDNNLLGTPIIADGKYIINNILIHGCEAIQIETENKFITVNYMLFYN